MSQTETAAVVYVQQVFTVPLLFSAADCPGGGGVYVGVGASSTAATSSGSGSADSTSATEEE